MALTRSLSSPPGLVVVIVALLVVCVLPGCNSEDDGGAQAQGTATTTSASVEPTATIETVCIEVEWSEPMWEKEVLVANVEQLFFARILSMGETIRGDGIPYVRTPFTVEVEERLLGDIEGSITVIQNGGYDRTYHNMVQWECDPLLEVGETYLLAARFDAHSPPGVNGYRLVDTYGTIQVQDEAHRKRLIREYTGAIEQAGLGSR